MVSKIDFPAFCTTPIPLPNLARRVKGIARKEYPLASRLQLFYLISIIPSNILDIFIKRIYKYLTLVPLYHHISKSLLPQAPTFDII
jgi:hypothetical protein